MAPLHCKAAAIKPARLRQRRLTWLYSGGPWQRWIMNSYWLRMEFSFLNLAKIPVRV